MPVRAPRHRSRALPAAVLAAALAISAACGGSGGSGTPASGSSGGGASTSSAPVKGGDLIIARTADSQSMNKTTVFQNESIWVFEQMYETLYTVTEDGKDTKPWLATSYTVSPDKLTYTFTLREGVTFSTGKPMTSADVKFSTDKATAATKGVGLPQRRHQGHQSPGPDKVRGRPEVSLGPVDRRPVAVQQRHHPGQLRRADRGGVLPAPRRDRAVQMGHLGQGQVPEAGPQRHLLAAGQAPPGLGHLDRHL